MARSRLIATRTQLQLQQTNEGNNINSEACRQFNDCTPGIQVPRSLTSEADNSILDTHQPNVNFQPVGTLSPRKAFQIFKDTQRLYAKCRHNFDASGQHSNNFWPFCQGNLDVLVLHHWLLHIGDPQLSNFILEGTKISGGLDTGEREGPDATPKPFPKIPNKRSGSVSDLVVEFRLRRESDEIFNATFFRNSREQQLSGLREDRVKAEDRVIFFEDRGEATGSRYDRAVQTVSKIDSSIDALEIELAELDSEQNKRQRVD